MSENPQKWFSSTVRIISIVEEIGALDYMDCVHVFYSTNWDDAFQRALTLGRTHESDYVNLDGRRVRLRLKEILTLDIIPHTDLDGAEVNSKMIDVPAGETSSFDTVFHPEESQPVQTM